MRKKSIIVRGCGHHLNGAASSSAGRKTRLHTQRARMGHRSTRAALIYLHARDHRDKEIASGIGRMVADAGAASGKGARTAQPRHRLMTTGDGLAWWRTWSGRRESNPRS
jgi:hypothetical protein